MIRKFLSSHIVRVAASALALLVGLTAPSGAQTNVHRNVAIDQFLERDAANAQKPTENEASTHRLRQGASGLGMRVKPTDRSSGGSTTAAKPGSIMQRLPAGQWVEGPGFNVTYGQAYESCAAKCIANLQCVMIEYYRPEKKCNLYSSKRPTKQGGSSDVAVRS